MIQVAENEKCIFYRNERCELIDNNPEYREKYGEYTSCLVKFKNESNRWGDETYILVHDNEIIAEVVWMSDRHILEKVMDTLDQV